VSDTSEKTVGEALVGLLEDYGIDTVFGIPGTHSIELYRGLDNSKITHYSPRHEQGGGFMADGYARLSGRPAACFVITGPGVTNISTPMGQAYSDSTPMLVISPVNPGTEVPEHNLGRLHEIADQAAVTRDLAVFSETAKDQEHLRDIVAVAFGAFSSQRPGPAHIHVPLPLFKEIATGNWSARNLPGKPEASDADISDAAERINAAKNPMIIVGGGMARSREAAAALAEKLDAPIASTTNAKGLLPLDHPLYLGSSLTQAATQALFDETDLLIALGTELTLTDYWLEDVPFPDNKIVVNLDEQLLDRQNEASQVIRADATRSAERLTAAISARSDTGAREKVARINASNQTPPEDEKTRAHLAVLDALHEALPEDAAVFTDMTQIAYSGNPTYPSTQHGNWFHPIGYGTLGYGLPAAMGAKLAEPNRAIVALVGDAGFQYTLQEMALAAETGLRVILVIWNNEALQQIADDMDDADITKIGVVQKNPDFQMLAKAYGWETVHAPTIDALGAAVKAALAHSGPSMIEVRDPEIRASMPAL